LKASNCSVRFTNDIAHSTLGFSIPSLICSTVLLASLVVTKSKSKLKCIYDKKLDSNLFLFGISQTISSSYGSWWALSVFLIFSNLIMVAISIPSQKSGNVIAYFFGIAFHEIRNFILMVYVLIFNYVKFYASAGNSVWWLFKYVAVCLVITFICDVGVIIVFFVSIYIFTSGVATNLALMKLVTFFGSLCFSALYKLGMIGATFVKIFWPEQSFNALPTRNYQIEDNDTPVESWAEFYNDLDIDKDYQALNWLNKN